MIAAAGGFNTPAGSRPWCFLPKAGLRPGPPGSPSGGKINRYKYTVILQIKRKEKS